MLDNNTASKLREMKMGVMATAFSHQLSDKAVSELSFEERVGLMVDAEWTSRKNNRLTRLIRNAGFSEPEASVEDIEYHPDRELDKSLILRLSTCNFVDEHHNIIILGASGSGKSYLANAFGVTAARKFHAVRYTRLPDLLGELAIARAEGTYRKMITVEGNDVEFTPPALVPSVDVTHDYPGGTTATLYGIYDLNGGTFVSGAFEISDDGGSSWSTPTDGTLDGLTTTPSVNLTGLAPGTTYHYRLTVTNSIGETITVMKELTISNFTITEKFVDSLGNPIMDAYSVAVPDTSQLIPPGSAYNGSASAIPLFACIGYRIGSVGGAFATATPGTSGNTSPTIPNVSEDQVVYYVYGLLVDVTVSKTTTGDYADKTKAFTFTVYFTNESGASLSAGTQFSYTGGIITGSGATAPSNGTLTLDSAGKTTIPLTLTHGQTITIADAVEGNKVRIVITADSKYTTTFVDSAFGTSETGGDTSLRAITAADRAFAVLHGLFRSSSVRSARGYPLDKQRVVYA